jgi:acetyltransferase-like isoleucine patch superfamily enzyme/GT2 family glycosyltransferase
MIPETNTHLPLSEVIDLSVVVIGRNEGERLVRCLDSIARCDRAGLTLEVIYVDSGSTDSSLRVAQDSGARALPLGDPKPCAAKARNLGWRSARGRYVLFLDGDTELEPDFIAQALPVLDDPALCAVWGHRREVRPQQSVYTRVLDLDWMYPPGPSLYFGGDVLVRRVALEQVGGFDPTLNAGEEPEMCARLRAQGWSIMHIDAPMTRHDLAISSLRAWARRSFRSGIAYAEVAWRMGRLGDPLWQHESRRDLVHGLVYSVAPLLVALAAWLAPAAAIAMACAALLLLARTAARARWRTADRGLAWLYAIHVHLQKVPAVAGQLTWHWAHHQRRTLGLVDYKGGCGPAAQDARSDACRVAPASFKSVLAQLLSPWAWFRREWLERGIRIWAFARLQSDMGRRLDPSNVVLGVVSVDGTRRISIGRDARISPGVHLETQGEGCIVIGDGVVISAGVHIVAFERVDIGTGALIGEYTSIRDANHRLGTDCTRHSGYDSAPVFIGRNVWIGRGVTVLKGARIGDHACVGANAVVTRDLPAHSRAVGAPARALAARS